MDAFCFTSTLNQLSAKNIADLQLAFTQFHGKPPSRREIRALSERIHISQSRIRKWFEGQQNEQTVSHSNGPSGDQCGSSRIGSQEEFNSTAHAELARLEQFFEETGCQLATVKDVLQSVGTTLSHISTALASL